jgi:hypothetical protein
MVKREDIGDVNLFTGDDDFFDQTLRHGLAIRKGKAIEVLAYEMTKVVDMGDDVVPVEGLLVGLR